MFTKGLSVYVASPTASNPTALHDAYVSFYDLFLCVSFLFISY